ncbi:hypothetical protein ACAW49_03230 [Pseudomonas sp. Env-44]|uniref:Antitoxin SocA-like Panacea domain-containing protein n=1 Tax=Pseudomonas synxantha TaxID=47883 RepID=A0AAX3I6S2_9PSED|nr:hypothetical protein [Pseudomonas synxantha]AZE67777.1 hypothetical protein C4K01_3584 [Pseudomonas synxantha]SDU18606.1 hypothetical protein SAMN05216475_1564 [Pseudomonas synxantha]VTQ97658.1 Uncharacterised protein [Pseudomonas synxantha]
MSATAEMLFNLQKFQLLTLFTSDRTGKNITPAYAYAWDNGVYPIANEGASWHEPYKEQFEIGEEQVSELAKFLENKWLEKEKISFYELEIHYGIRGAARSAYEWERGSLINACRYFYLSDWFDDEFWKGLVGHSDCPSESHSIRREFKPEGVYFL